VCAAPATPVVDVWHVGPTPDVRAICHTGNVLWIGTAAGLYLVDLRNGGTLAHIGAGPRLASTSVRAIAAKGDSVFVGTDAGLSLFRPGDGDGGMTATVFTTTSPGKLGAVPLARIHGLGVGTNGDILLATSGRGAGILTKRGGYTITRRDSLLEDKVFSIADRADGTRYFATAMGLCAQVNDTSFVSFQAGSGIPRGEVRAVIPAERNQFYLLVANHGVFRFDGARAVAIDSPSGISLRDAAAISVGTDGTLWAVGDGWVFARRRGKWTRAPVPAADATARWRVVVADGAGAFIGSSDGRVVALGRGGAFRVALPEGLPAARVQSLAPALDAAWFVCDGRLVRADATARRFVLDDAARAVRAISVSPQGDVWTAGRWTVRRRVADAWVDMAPDIVESDPAYTSLFADEAGAWVGTRAGALYRFDGTLWLRHARAGNGAGGAVGEIHAADNGAWALSGGRAARCGDGVWRRYAGIDSGAVVVDLARSPDGNWLAATESKLFSFDEAKAKWTPAREWNSKTPAGLGPLRGRMRAVAFDERGRLVVGTTEGVALCGPQGVKWLTAEDGIGGREIADVAVAGNRIWIGFAEDGVSVISVRELW